MSIKERFKAAVNELSERGIPYAVAGGLAAGLYRDAPRMTMDIDLAVALNEGEEQRAVEVVKALGLKPGILRKAELDGGPLFAIKRNSTPPCMIVGTVVDSPVHEGVDLLLPAIPWVRVAVLRSRDNTVDFGFGPQPVLTAEDVLVSKLYATHRARARPGDLDDIQSICAAQNDLNLPYVAGRIQELNMRISSTALPFLPEPLLDVLRSVQHIRPPRR